MLEFMLALEYLLRRWPDSVKMNIIQIAEQTETPTPHVMEYLTEALNKNLDPHDPISFNEASKAYGIIYEKSQDELHKRQQNTQLQVQKTLANYEIALEKVKMMQCSKNWRGAYRTLDYFFGKNKQYLSNELTVSICSECLRLGIKGSINFQELSQWLRQGISTLLSSNNQNAIESALDFIDAYGEYFIEAEGNRGENYIASLLMDLKPSVMEFNLTDRLNEVAGELRITSVMDITL
jgi:uncharacterized protein with ATP-grasp and redox domains